MGMSRVTEIVDITELTPNEVVAKVNAASAQITRDDAVDAKTVSGWSDVVIEIKDALKAKPDKDRGVIFSEPTASGFVVAAINRKSNGEYEFIFDDDPVV